MRVQENVGGVDVRELRSELLHEEGRRAHHAYHAKHHPQQSTSSIRFWINPLTNATCKVGSLLSRCVPTLKCNVTSKSMASEMKTECVSTECTEMPDGIALEGDVLPDPQIPGVVLIRTSLQISARISFTVEGITSCAKEDCKPERRRYFHQLMSQSSWLINETLLHRHLHLQTATAPTRRRLRCRAAKQPKRHHCESFPQGWLCRSVSATWNWKT